MRQKGQVAAIDLIEDIRLFLLPRSAVRFESYVRAQEHVRFAQ